MTPEDLNKIRPHSEAETKQQFKYHLNVCVAAGCLSLHSDQLKESLEKEVKSAGMEKTCHVRRHRWQPRAGEGRCSAGRLVINETTWRHGNDVS